MVKPGDTNTISGTVTELANFAKDKTTTVNLEQYQAKLEILRNECDKGVEYRVFAGKSSHTGSIPF